MRLQAKEKKNRRAPLTIRTFTPLFEGVTPLKNLSFIQLSNQGEALRISQSNVQTLLGMFERD